MTLQEPGYRPRLLDPIIEQDLRSFGAVNIEGPKWCGKTWTSLAHAESTFFLMDPDGDFANRRLAELEPSAVMDGAAPRLLDEWQEVPALWDAVRFHVDRAGQPGRFLLTGSTKPHDKPRHSGIGRIITRQMRPMSLVESGDSTGAASLTELFGGQTLRPVQSDITLEGLIELAQRGGWPAVVRMHDSDNSGNLARGYIDQLVRVDIPQAAGRTFDYTKLRAVIGSLARNTATLVQIPTIVRDMSQWFGTEATEATVRVYLDALRSLYVLEEIPAWSLGLRSSSKLRKSPKRILADPSLAIAAMGATPATLKADLFTFGFVFESLCLRDLLVYADTIGASVSHYRDDSNLEADAIITLRDGRWGAIEIKLGTRQVDDAATNLLRLATKIEAGGHPRPAMLAVIVGVGGVAQTRPDGVHVIPVDILGP